MQSCLKISLDRAKDACQRAVADVAPWRVALDELESFTSGRLLNIDLAASFNIVEITPPLTEDLEETAERFFEKLKTFVKELIPDKNGFNGVDLYERLGKDMPSENSLQARCGAACEHDVGSKCLGWRSCVDNKNHGFRMVRQEERCPYNEFRKWYPEWEDIPDVQHSRPIREFLFFNCQPELLNKYPRLNACEDLDKSNFSRHRLEDLLQTARSMAFD
eukprot:IDg17563t1